jgi:hypothetical protein
MWSKTGIWKVRGMGRGFEKGSYPICLREDIKHIRISKLQARRSRVRFPMVSLEFFIDIILPTAL